MALLCLAAQGKPYGYITVGGRVPDRLELFRLTCPHDTRPRQFDSWLAELERKGVARRTETGILYSVRMVRDAARADHAANAGKAPKRSHTKANHEPLGSQSRANHEPQLSAQTRRNGHPIVAGDNTEAEARINFPYREVDSCVPDDASEKRVVRLQDARAFPARLTDEDGMQRLRAMAQDFNDHDT